MADHDVQKATAKQAVIQGCVCKDLPKAVTLRAGVSCLIQHSTFIDVGIAIEVFLGLSKTNSEGK